MPNHILGIDTGGTFTDFVVLDAHGRIKRWKVLSSPADPSEAIVRGLMEILGEELPKGMEIVHGTTVGTNAFLERKGAKTVLLTTKGFEDVLFIGRQARPCLYDLYCQKPREVIPRDMILGLGERCNADGKIIKEVEQGELERCLGSIRDAGAESVAVCLLHSYKNPENEEKVGKYLEKHQIKVFLSSRLLPEFREFERTSTTVINAYLGPVVGSYIRSLEERLPGSSILVQQSGGGCRPAKHIEEVAVTTILSGPAGGVLAGLELGRSLGVSHIITFDMGGTSTDVSLCPGRLVFTRDYQIEGFPINLPVIDVHTVGAGGGSIAWIDRGGLLKVGPQSAGADPGPVCYGKGEELTVTDANLFLGRLKADRFLGGRMRLFEDRVKEKMALLADRLGIGPMETALGIIKLVNTNMVQALRRVSIEKGYDPRKFHIVSFGGAAGVHTLDVAEELGVSSVIIPEMAGVFSAQGLAASSLTFEASLSLFWRSDRDNKEKIRKAGQSLEDALLNEASGFISQAAEIKKELFLDVRYLGQSFEIMVPFEKGWQKLFHREHERLYGYCLMDETLEVTSIRLKIRISRGKRGTFFEKTGLDFLKGFKEANPAVFSFESSDIIFKNGAINVPVVDRKDIPEGVLLTGPFLITDDFTTILITAGWQVSRLKGHLLAKKV